MVDVDRWAINKRVIAPKSGYDMLVSTQCVGIISFATRMTNVRPEFFKKSSSKIRYLEASFTAPLP